VPIDASARESLKHLPNATLIEYEDEPHGLFLTATERLNNDLLQFLDGAAIVQPPAVAPGEEYTIDIPAPYTV